MKNDNTAYLVIIFPKIGRIMDRLSAMALLVKVTELGSMSAAARALNTPLTTVSRNIGELVISAPTMFGRQHVLPVISEFIARYPQIRVRLLLSDSNADLVDDHIDLAVRIGELADSSMVATRLGAMRIVACAHPALLAKYGEPQRPRDLAALPIIRIESPMPYRGWRFRAVEREDQLIHLPPVLAVTTPESAADAARLGVGVARLLHYQALDGLRCGELRLLLESVEPEPAPVHLLYTARELAPLKLRKFIDFAAPALRQSLLRIAGAV
ncbi:LysR family transcriptional regulator [Klebsiella aerogenes]|uniref:LysR family transcriptional regulator n=1 Tax=Klebsiella aerogenes TaxID=548 RepID=UPI00164E8F3C|nr:LysR family transcriptional regulator [Klebsiella aerogenes]